jgi:hypothetical protein
VSNSGAATLTGTIVAGNSGPGGASDVVGSSTVTGRYNLIGTGGADGLEEGHAGNQVGVANPLLGALGNYGGPTQTIPLLPGSPALGEGAAIKGIIDDQRGVSRPASHPDIGAFQSQGFTLKVVAGTTPQSAAVGTAFAKALVVTVTANNPNEPVAGGVVTFTAPSGAASAVLSGHSATIGSHRTASIKATANKIVGSYTVTAKTAGTAVAARFSLTNKRITPA